MAIITSVSTAWLTTKKVQNILVDQGLKVTESLAEQSALALLYRSGDNANDAINTALAFPAISYVAILDNQSKTLIKKGDEKGEVFPIVMHHDTKGRINLVNETESEWHFAAFVYANNNENYVSEAQYLDEDLSNEMLGYVYVIMQKKMLYDIQYSTFRNNISIAFLVTTFLMLFVHFGVRYITQPLSKLANMMERAKQGEWNISADFSGAKEVIVISSAFNKMIEAIAERDRKLRQHNLQLESEVQLRTRELVRARDAALDASRHKSEFLANVTHELRTPLQSIIGYTDLLIESLEEEGEYDLVEDQKRVLQNANHLLSLINGILDIAKIEAGRMLVELEEVNIQLLLLDIEKIIMPLVNKNGNKLEIELDECNGCLIIDREKLLEIILNLLSNAAKFTEGGLIKLQIIQSENKLSVFVSDTGVGIPENQLSVIFEPFRQVDGSTTRTHQGTGLGLSIVQQFCQLLGGKISVKSMPGYGTTFTAIIPLPVQRGEIHT